ncbi:putative RNA-directed DNA polymerase [Senna tora]|uniref:Putative RNA-directed DNA polymerase n=1 Tax=Senna tora TaxID=362788 RepID=A0A834THM6_9FABA|nr:putative RNA-directed DNA polymerase [Senna tora]
MADASANNGSVPANGNFSDAGRKACIRFWICTGWPMHSPRPNLLLMLLKLQRTFGFKPMRWEMTDDKDMKSQINEYLQLLKELKAEKINFLDEFVAGILIEKLSDSWSDYKQQLKHKQKQLSIDNSIK